jgi:TRAP-type uncharacterized transport system fused permease subunit
MLTRGINGATAFEIFMSIIFILIVLEATRRFIGLPLVFVGGTPGHIRVKC